MVNHGLGSEVEPERSQNYRALLGLRDQVPDRARVPDLVSKPDGLLEAILNKQCSW